MKIIIEGKLPPPPPPPWWRECYHTCGNCKTVYMLDTGDEALVIVSNGGGRTAQTTCPLCYSPVNTEKNKADYPAQEAKEQPNGSL